MSRTPSLTTDRLLLRRWLPADRAPFAALNADPEVMKHFPALMSREDSDALVDRIEAPFLPAVEIGWRLARPFWGHGYAAEAARRSLAFAFEALALDEVLSFTATTNTRSQAVMARIGMVHHPA